MAELEPGTYWLQETQAPTGFELLAQPVQFTLDADGTITLGDGAAEGVIRVEAEAHEGGQTIVVTDIPSFDLPDVGGTGTLYYWSIGIGTLMLALMATLAMRRRA